MFKYVKVITSSVLLTLSAFSMEKEHVGIGSMTIHPQSMEVAKQTQRYGYVRDSESHHGSHDWLVSQAQHYSGHFMGTYTATKNLPTVVDMRNYCPAVYNQGQLGSCTANAIAGAIETDMIRQGMTHYTPSRLFIYYNERKLEGTVNSDAGASLTDGLRSICTQGACHESMWTYDDGQTKFRKMPPAACYKDARSCMDLDVLRLASIHQDLGSIKAVLATNTPIVFGISVYESFESDEVARTGIVPMPNTAKEQLLGGHAVMLAGYDDHAQRFLVRNSWGSDWGIGGYFEIPYQYVTNNQLAFDFWKISKIGKK